MTPRKPGRLFWVGTFAIGIFSPGGGKRRIRDRMQENWRALCEERQRVSELTDRNSELTKENQFLRRELARVEGEKNLLLLQDDINDVVTAEPAFRNQPVGHEAQSSMSMHTIEQPLAKASPGNVPQR